MSIESYDRDVADNEPEWSLVDSLASTYPDRQLLEVAFDHCISTDDIRLFANDYLSKQLGNNNGFLPEAVDEMLNSVSAYAANMKRWYPEGAGITTERMKFWFVACGVEPNEKDALYAKLRTLYEEWCGPPEVPIAPTRRSALDFLLKFVGLGH